MGRIRPVLEYGIAATATAAKSNSDRLARLQNQAMRMMTGAMRSTPITALETATGLQPLDDRKNIKVLTQAAKFKRLQNHPMHERMNMPTKGRLKRSSFINQSRILEKIDPEILNHIPTPIPITASVPSWERLKFPAIREDIPGIGKKGTQSDPERKSLTLEFIQFTYPEEQWARMGLPQRQRGMEEEECISDTPGTRLTSP